MACWPGDSYRFVMFAQGSMYHTTIEQDLRGVGDGVEGLQGCLEFVVVVVTQCRYPRLDLLSPKGQRHKRIG